MSTRHPDKSVAAEQSQLDGQTIASNYRELQLVRAQLQRAFDTISARNSEIVKLKADLAVAQAGVSLIVDADKYEMSGEEFLGGRM